MARLTKGRRKKLRKTQFASPRGQGPNRKANQFPIHDRRHAANAKGRATQSFNRGLISRSKLTQIHARANKVLKRKGKR